MINYDDSQMIFLNIYNIYFDNILSQIYPSVSQLNKANTSDTEASFFSDLNVSIANDIVSTKLYDFDFEFCQFPII